MKLTQTSSQQKQTVDFFDSVAVEYDNKYRSKDAFYSYFFWQRIFEATADIDFHEKAILDVGCGTGQLYNFLNSRIKDIDYSGSDISQNMLIQSKIPANCQYAGNLYQLDFRGKLFDIVFMLGVSTYMTKEEWNANLSKINSILKPGGKFIVSFTNKNSFDYKMRMLGQVPARFFKKDNKVIGRKFVIHSYSLTEIEQNLDGFKIDQVKWLNQTIFPFNKIFPVLSVKIADKINRNSKGRILETMSSDFLVFTTKL
ncbi:MAG: class I SAM-dependent methyltransferase [Chitinophagales bacterium]|nr:class I SAM-dependent methyltransferase [Chitinophagales bacterium]